MNTRAWLDEVARQLHGSGTSVAYQRRLLDELRDHLDDLSCDERNHAMSAETMGTEMLATRVGEPKEIAAAAELNVARAKFARRHPIVTYLLLPLPALLALWAAYAFGLVGVLKLLQSYKNTDWAATSANIVVHSLAYVPAIALVLIIAWVALRSQTRTAWWLAASTLVAVLSGLMMVNFRMPTTPGTGMLQIGVGFPPDLARWPQFVLPLAVTLAFACHAMMKRRREEAHLSV